jgi:hypothetical protein
MSKGSKPRPFSVTQQEYDSRWDAIFGRDIEEVILEMPGTIGSAKIIFKEDNTGTNKNEYYDVLSTEEALNKLSRINQELDLYDMDPSENPLIKK